MKEMNASDFKAHCLAVLDDVAATREPVRILKRGRPVAVLVPPLPLDERAPQATLAGTLEILGDVVAPALPAVEWEAEGGTSG
jgi:prevent-host-death family protein